MLLQLLGFIFIMLSCYYHEIFINKLLQFLHSLPILLQLPIGSRSSFRFTVLSSPYILLKTMYTFFFSCTKTFLLASVLEIKEALHSCFLASACPAILHVNSRNLYKSWFNFTSHLRLKEVVCPFTASQEKLSKY